ncbi:DsrE/DsrF/DrsH-like family protein [Candidatus Magnetominusculus dajiuhuensis]|uniref:DsrE/DsrF/DrsH-like family protein n=1 Tax=Candidatus Magnetominusculus dajiuhuensis TaxID=3137712 RepID=UPI0019DFFE6E|nr:DsrE/DsrF/DrsH-like family protein [Nitrospirota bacterium]MBF0568516.1 DsrE/DsrF/DrsH-like family protein [Nitrospirota bacterium]
MTAKKKRMAVIASKGTLDMAYPPLILASTAAAMDVDVQIFFTLYGVDIINKKKYRNLQVSPIGNPAMPSPIPMPNIIGMLPGMTPMATSMMKGMIKKINWPSIPELVDACREMDVKMLACTPTLEMTNVSKDDLVDGVMVAGAAEFLNFALDADITLFI